ncbi:MAG: signal recognition particle-docking protein FtsY [Pseudomonadota bacterium]
MAFFKKLKDRLFKSSAKLDQGLEDLVSEGAEAEADAPSGSKPAPQPAPEPAPQAEAPAPLALAPAPAPAPEPVNRVQSAPAPEPGPPDPPPSLSPMPEAAQEVAPAPAPEPELPTDAEPEPRPEPEPAPERKPGFLARAFGAKPALPTRVLDDEMLESLEEVLIQADMGVETSIALSARLSEAHYGRRVSTPELKGLIAREIAEVLRPVARPLPIYAKRPQVVLVVGVNGSGKTTTIGKLASQLRAAGKKVVIAAGDTFRAAAVEQLQVWGERAGVPVMTAPQGSDPASLAYDAFVRAEAEGADLLLVDTAGRLQNRQDLMEELAKIVRVIRKKDPEAPHNTVLVLDATTGQNALTQVDTFRRIADVTGLVMTKLDGTAKGGVLVALADRFGLPIHAIGVGEQIDDLSAFDPEDFAAAITGTEL